MSETSPKRTIAKFFSFLSLFILVALVVSFFIQPKKIASLVSPLPETPQNFLSFLKLPVKFTYSANLWLPNEKAVFLSSVPKPEITAKSAIVIGLKDDKVLFEKESRKRVPVASTLKIMTAILALENANLGDEFVVSEKAATIGEDSMGLSAGERLTLKELLYGLMLVSGNDSAIAIAEGIAGSQENFVKMMNQKAEFLGLSDTLFRNSTGLEEEELQYSSAYDMAVVAHYAWVNFPVFREIVGTLSYEILQADKHKYFYLENQTNLLRTYPGVKGIKPGFTPLAGLCLVTLVENEGYEVLAVVLGSEDRRGEMKKLLDYSFQSLGISILQVS